MSERASRSNFNVMKDAFKEWAVIVDALGRGEQILLLRKGGIHEGRSGFQMKHERFLLFPTRFHQQLEAVVDSARQRFDEVLNHPMDSDSVPIQYFADAVDCRRLESGESVEALRGQHIWREEVIRERFQWGRESAIFAIAVRVWRLPWAVTLKMRPEYGGCKSWIELNEDIDISGAAPVLSESRFQERRQQFENAITAAPHH